MLSDLMTDYSALLTEAGADVRVRRLPFGGWQQHSFISAAELAQPSTAAAKDVRFSLGMTVYLGNALVRLAVLPPVRNAKSISDFKAIAAHVLEQRHGLTQAEWEIAADPTSELGLVACAVRREALTTARRLTERLGRRLRRARVWAGEALPRQPDKATLLDDGEASVVFVPESTGNTPQLHVVPNDRVSRLVASMGVVDILTLSISDDGTGPKQKNYLDRLRTQA